MRDVTRARIEPINRASIRRSGLATTQRFDRAGSRGERPNNSVAVRGLGARGTAADAVQGKNGPVHKYR